jgi:hypothetical protein
MNKTLLAVIVAMAGLFCAAVASGQTIQMNVMYVCNGERIEIDSCNIRDTSDTSKCMVGHPDTVLKNGLMKYTYETRGDLKKLLPTCKQPSSKDVASAQAFNKKIQDQQDAAIKRAAWLREGLPLFASETGSWTRSCLTSTACSVPLLQELSARKLPDRKCPACSSATASGG